MSTSTSEMAGDPVTYASTDEHKKRWNGFTAEGALDQVDLSTPSEERTRALRREINYMVAHSVYRHGKDKEESSHSGGKDKEGAGSSDRLRYNDKSDNHVPGDAINYLFVEYHGYGILARPLTNLLKHKAKFDWTPEVDTAFLKLKEAMITTPVLALPDFQKQFMIETDACDSGVGAVLMQEGHPIAFLRKPLSVQHKSLSIYEKEFLALIMAVERWRPYLQRGEFVIKTDHHNLTYLDEQTLQSPMQRKAMARMMGLQFKISYKKGAENSSDDALSRVGQVFQLQAISEVRRIWFQEVINSYVTDPVA
ncbi:hypothetical protein QYE76_046594 [Lolium multiflorum]|uniref:Reverse transcriptase/retrotransposon-derived protein RNase H-like domain-containing protein n=1 Tax=Lolium multiflorum TaxID=4521 RepID=A0AAD8TNM3_LOLMU|nr:hypothetical protein QYE76_046594 [Lolium multiflorum]